MRLEVNNSFNFIYTDTSVKNMLKKYPSTNLSKPDRIGSAFKLHKKLTYDTSKP